VERLPLRLIDFIPESCEIDMRPTIKFEVPFLGALIVISMKKLQFNFGSSFLYETFPFIGRHRQIKEMLKLILTLSHL
jgi:hypothetical protein